MRVPKPSKEQQLLFDLLKGDPPSTLEGMDTALLFELFRRHRLFPLAPSLIYLLDSDDKETWLQAWREGSMRTLALVSRLLDIVNRLEAEGMRVRPLKGPVLAQSLYGDINQRQMRDLDLLVSQDDLMKILGILQEMRYELKIPGKNLSAAQWRTYFKQQYDVGLVHRDDGSIVELHTRIAYPGLLGSMEHLITREVEELELAGRKIKCLSREGTFLYLAIHGAHHLFFRLFWLRDLAEALVRWDLDHARIAGLAQEMGLDRMLGLGLRLAQLYFGTSIPEAYKPLQDRQERKLEKMIARCQRAICEPRFYGRSSRINVLLFYLDLKPGWRHKYQTLASVLHRWYIRRILVR